MQRTNVQRKRYTRRYKAYAKRKFFKRRNQITSKYESTMVRQVGRPDKLIVKLPYAQQVGLTGNPFSSVNLLVNSLYDIDTAIGGGQPAYYDNYSAIYNRYRVIGVKYNVQVHNYTGGRLATVGICWNNGTAPTLANCEYQPKSEFKQLGGAGASSDSCEFNGYVSLAGVTGVTRSTYMSDDTYAGQTSGSPTEVIWLSIWGKDWLATAACGCAATVKLILYCEFYDPYNVTDV